ncbi:Copine like protein, partial [Aduncisulcus paluster]
MVCTGAAPVRIMNTNVIMNNENPDWREMALVTYRLESADMVKISIYDADSKDLTKLSKHDFIGYVQFQLASLIVSREGVLELPILGKDGKKLPLVHKKPPIFIVSGEIAKASNAFADMEFKALRVDKKDVFGKSDPYLLFYKSKETRTTVPDAIEASSPSCSTSWYLSHKTEVIRKTLDPCWKPFTVNLQSLCNGDLGRPIKIECWDWDRVSSDDFIGSVITDVNELHKLSQSKDGLPLLSEHKRQKLLKKKKSYINSGMLYPMKMHIYKKPQFIDYVNSGTCQISLSVAVDFTGSNGYPSNPSSLHYIGAGVSA